MTLFYYFGWRIEKKRGSRFYLREFDIHWTNFSKGFNMKLNTLLSVSGDLRVSIFFQASGFLLPINAWKAATLKMVENIFDPILWGNFEPF